MAMNNPLFDLSPEERGLFMKGMRARAAGWTRKPEEPTPADPQPKPDTRPVGVTEARLHERSAELLNVVSVLTEACEKAFEKLQADVRKLETELARSEARTAKLIANTIAKLVPSPSGAGSVLDPSPLSPRDRRVN